MEANGIFSFKVVVLCLYRCHIRVIDTFGTEPAYNHEEYATLHGYRTNWGYWNLNARQYMTMFRKNKTTSLIFKNLHLICCSSSVIHHAYCQHSDGCFTELIMLIYTSHYK